MSYSYLHVVLKGLNGAYKAYLTVMIFSAL